MISTGVDLNPQSIRKKLSAEFASELLTIDSHTAGEQTRLIVAGVEPLPGETLSAKRQIFMTQCDQVRQRLTREPRGSRGILAACLTAPTSAGAAFGLIFMDARRYPYLCGHATIGAVATLIETGILTAQDGDNSVIVDTPSGPMHTVAQVRHGKVDGVTLRMVPSFVYSRNQVIESRELGKVSVDTVCVGGFFIMVSAGQLALELALENRDRLTALGMNLIDAANRQLHVAHPLRPEVNTVDVVEFYDPSGHDRFQGRNFVVYGEAQLDRSPCGTGTSAKMTLLHQKGLLPPGQKFVNQGPLGTRFEGRIVAETRVGDLAAVETEVSGNAQITGIHRFVLDPRDPFPEGFLL